MRLIEDPPAGLVSSTAWMGPVQYDAVAILRHLAICDMGRISRKAIRHFLNSTMHEKVR